MSLSSATSSISYTGNGSVATYSYTFRIDSQTDLRVLKVTDAGVVTVLTLTTDYTVTGVGNGTGGTITLVAGNLPADYKLILRRKLSLTQDTEIRNEGTYFASEHENKFDELTMQDQQQQFELDRSLKLPEEVDTADFDMTLPATIVGAASRVPTVNATGDGWLDADEWVQVTELSAAVAAADAAAASAVNAATSETNAAASATASNDDATLSANHSTTASRWAKYTTGTVVDVVTSVDSLEYSAKEYAIGILNRGLAGGGSAKDWANYTSGLVDNTEYSAKKYAIDAAASAAAAAIGSSVVGTRAAPIAITAGGGISFAAAAITHHYIEGDGGPVTVTANPQIAAGTQVGQTLLLIGRSDTNTVTLANGTGLSLNGGITLGEDETIYLYWDNVNWSEFSRRI